MQTIILSQIPISELAKLIAQDIINNNIAPVQENEYLTRKEASKLFHMSLVTLNKHTKSKKIKSYKIGARVLYKRSELLEIDTT